LLVVFSFVNIIQVMKLRKLSDLHQSTDRLGRSSTKCWLWYITVVT